MGIAHRIAGLLEELEEQGVEKISIRDLKDTLKADLPKNSRTFQKARDKALALTQGRWVLERRSLVRVAGDYADFYGFDADELALAS